MDSNQRSIFKSELKIDLKSTVCCSICQTNFNSTNNKQICSFCEQNQLKNCSICNQLILNEKFVCFNDKSVHIDCFRCSNCSTCLANQINIHQIQSKIFCSKCFQEKFTFECNQCHQLILEGKSIEFHQQRYHSQCFICCFCNKLIVEQQVYLINCKPCCQICYQTNLLPKCYKCLKIIQDQHSIIFQENKYHQQCLTCFQCQQTIQQNQIPIHNGNPFCSNCYREKILPKCFQCSKPIEDQQSTVFQGNKYHQQCFICILCRQIMNETTFYTYHDQPCCSICYQTNILPKCSKCLKSIDSKYKIFQNQNYHIECFICSICKKTIESNDKCQIDQQSNNIRCSKCFI